MLAISGNKVGHGPLQFTRNEPFALEAHQQCNRNRMHFPCCHADVDILSIFCEWIQRVHTPLKEEA
jgi:hypothetical protein